MAGRIHMRLPYAFDDMKIGSAYACTPMRTMTSVDFVSSGLGTTFLANHWSLESFSSYALSTWALMLSSVCAASLALAISEAPQHSLCQCPLHSPYV